MTDGQPQPPQVVYVQQPKAPGGGALVLSILGFCGITALLGVILGFSARGKARHMGLPTGKATAAIVIGLLWLVPLGVGAMITAVNGGSTPTSSATYSGSSASSPEPISQDDLIGGAWSVCKENVLDQLKSPSSAEFPLYSSSDMQTQVTGQVVGIVAWVDAENSFGAKTRTPFSCSANYDPASDSYTVFAELDSTTMPTATGAGGQTAEEAVALLTKRGFTCDGPRGKFDRYQCTKGTVKVPTYGTQPKEMINIETGTTGLSLEGYATPTTVKALKRFGVTSYGKEENGAVMMGNG